MRRFKKPIFVENGLTTINVFKHDEHRSRAYRSYYILDFDTFCQRLVHTFLNFVKKLVKAYQIILNDFK